MSPVVTSWTELQIPTSKRTEDEKSGDGNECLLTTTYRNPKKTSGFYQACFGRVTESPKTVWYTTAWQPVESPDQFEKSNDYRLQHEEHSKWSTAPLKTHHCDMESPFRH